jgi:hypothetical protein
MAKTRHKIKLTGCDFTIFSSSNFLQIHIISVSGDCSHFISKHLSNCCRHNYDQSISRIFQSNFWRVSVIWSNCAPLISTTQATRAGEVGRLAIELMPLSKPHRVPLSFLVDKVGGQDT